MWWGGGTKGKDVWGMLLILPNSFPSPKLIALAASSLAGATHLPAPGLTLDPDWEIEPDTLVLGSKLGEGEFGVVYRALWHGTAVAAKVLKASSDIALGDFRSEIEVLRKVGGGAGWSRGVGVRRSARAAPTLPPSPAPQVHHPNAVQFLGACTKKEPYILVTELMPGGSVADAMTPGPHTGFTPRRALEVALDTARGLAYMHSRKQVWACVRGWWVGAGGARARAATPSPPSPPRAPSCTAT